MKKIALLALSSILASHSLYAKQKPALPSKAAKIWQGSASLGININTGNTNNKNYNADVTLQYNPTVTWSNNLEFTGQLQNTDGEEKSQRYDIMGQSKYSFTKLNFAYLNADFKQDKFSPYLWETTTSVGYGRRLLDWRHMSLDMQAGPGVRQNRQRDVAEPKTRREWILFSQATYQWQITKATTLSEVINNQAGHPDIYTKSVTSLNTKIIGNLGMQLSYTLEHHSFIPEDSSNKKKTDTSTNIALVYSFL